MTMGESIDENAEVDPLDVYMMEINSLLQPLEKKAKMTVCSFSSTDDGKSKGDILEAEDDIQNFSNEAEVESGTLSLITKSRQLAQTDHSKVYYRPFRKDFYVEVPELAKMTKKDVEEYRHKLEEIKVRGGKCPKPIKNWAQCGLGTRVLNCLKRYGYTVPTPIQAQAIPAIMSGRDVIGIAKTGSGKTLAFLLPMFRHILDQPELEEMDGPIALLMSPTRELALQTWREANKIAKHLGIRAVCIYGGVGVAEQIGMLKNGAEIIVCTPGRMTDVLAANSGNVTNLRRVTYLVLDEADRMFDMGFEPQVMKIVNNVRPDRQTVFFSATFPKQMEALARKVLDKPIEIQVGGKSIVCKDVEQHALLLDEDQKILKLQELLAQYWEFGNTLVFVDKQEKADDIVMQLMGVGYKCAPLHGGIDQFDRDSTICDFKTGKLKLMVATSVAARGLDVKKLFLVVNYDCPNHYEDYVHRVGRTGRAGNKGKAFTFILKEGQEKMAGEVCRAFETAGAQPPEDVKTAWETYRDKMQAEGVEIQTGGGFSGSGFKYDENEEEAEDKKRKMAQLVLGMEASLADEDDIESQLTNMMKSNRRVVRRKLQESRMESNAVESRIAAAKAAAEKIAATKLNVRTPVEKNATSQTAHDIMKGQLSAPILLSPMIIAKQKASMINERLNYLPSKVTVNETAQEEVQYFEEQLEINDFPQQVRYKVCSRESLAQVQEFADVGISVRGTHYPAGKDPKGNDRKLTLMLEARDEISLRRAKEEIVRIMRDSFQQMMSSGNRQQAGGRYKVSF